MLHEERRQRLGEFVEWSRTHITGDEKGESQIFLDRLFQAFGQKGAREAGATLEMRVKKSDGGGTTFADLVWKPVVLIEMKKRGVDLSRHFRQAIDYWTYLVPGRPRFVVLCNFDEFWIYDFETQMDSPLDKVSLVELPEKFGPLAFLFPGNIQPTFGNDHEAVTRKAADLLAQCFNKLIARKVDHRLAQTFTLQILVALFSQNIGLLEQYFVTQLLEECKSPADTFDLLGGLFIAMNTKGVSGGRFKGVEYFNGGLFAEPSQLELEAGELSDLRLASKSDWSQVRPEIFGTLFEHSLGEEERHAFGAHFTSPVDIMKIVGPTIVEPWRDQIENASTNRKLNELLNRLHSYRVLDPACGSGNFLYLAYRELKRLEVRLFERLAEISKKADAAQGVFGFVHTEQFFGLDINPFAIEIAKVTMVIGRKLAIDELHMVEPALPMDNLNQNFIAGDALIDQSGNPAVWPKADVIIGNPPFLGAKRLKPERGIAYVNAVRKAYPEVPGMADYCVYWLRKANDALPDCTAEDPVAGRGGLVGTQNIRNNQSRVGGLDVIAENGTIVEAVDNQPWSGEATVHVSIANWVKTQDPSLLPKARRLWFTIKRSGKSSRRKAGKGPASKEYELDMREVDHINSALSDQTDVSQAAVLKCNSGVCYTGQYPRHNGFMLDTLAGRIMIQASARNREVVWPFLTGEELISLASPKRWVIDFQTRDILDARTYDAPFEHVETSVLPYIREKAEKERKATGKPTGQDQNWLQAWWQHFRPRPELISKISTQPRFIACSRVTKRPIFEFVSSMIRPGDALSCFALADDYSFGVLQSFVHWVWFVTKCSKLKSDFRYTPESVFDTFAWPQEPKVNQIDAVAEASREVRRVRAEALIKVGGGLRGVYRLMELPGKNPLKQATFALDAAVMAAYGFSAKKDHLAQLLKLNADVLARINSGETVVGPGIPPSYPDQEGLVTDDCIRAT